MGREEAISEFGRRIKAWRRERGLDQREYGRILMRIGQPFVSRVERGEIAPSANMLLALEYDLVPPVPFDDLKPLAEKALTERVLQEWYWHRDRLERVEREGERRGLPPRQRRLLREVERLARLEETPHTPPSEGEE